MAEILVCEVEVAPVRAEPSHAAEQFTQALRGEPLAVAERRAGWARIRTAYDYPGWIEEAALAQGTPGEWMPAPSCTDPIEEASTERAGGVVEEDEPDELRQDRRRIVRLQGP